MFQKDGRCDVVSVVSGGWEVWGAALGAVGAVGEI